MNRARQAASQATAAPRYLGYIFASADLVFEIGHTGRVHNVLGAAGNLTGRDPAALEGQPWRNLFSQRDRDLVHQLLDAMRPGVRKGPIRLKLKNTRLDEAASPYLGMSIFQADESLPVSVSLSLSGIPDVPREPTLPSGLLTQSELEEDLAALLSQIKADGGRIRLEMLELRGLAEGLAQLDPHARDRLEQRFNASLRAASVRGGSAAELGDERYVILADQAAEGDLSRTLEKLGAEFGVPLAAHQESAPLSGELTPNQTVRALKVALDIFTREGVANAAQSLNEVIASTSAKSRRICEIIEQDRFALLFQPIVDFTFGGVHHYEALARLGGGGESPAESMRLAEELAIVDRFDHAVAAEAIRTLRDSPDESLRIAVNVSPFTFVQEGYVRAVLSQLAANGVQPRRLLVELTETAPIDDFETVRARIGQLRAAGCKFCLDDLGSGAASLDYLRLLPFDFVKLDGRFIEGLAHDRRAQLLIENLVSMCRALGGSVIAEQIETEEVASLLKIAEVSLGQGWLFGKAGPLPDYDPNPLVPAKRRVGARER